VVVDESVADALAAGSAEQRRIFVAGCAERMAQLFGAVRSPDRDRADDIAAYVESVNALWDADTSAEAFQAAIDRLDRFAELQDDDELLEVADTYAFYSVLTLLYALRCAASDDQQNCLKCAHAALTAMGQLDRNVPSARLMDQERQRQQEVSALPPADLTASSAAMREADAAIGRERAGVVLARMRA
jgi:hypothetical protein